MKEHSLTIAWGACIILCLIAMVLQALQLITIIQSTIPFGLLLIVFFMTVIKDVFGGWKK